MKRITLCLAVLAAIAALPIAPGPLAAIAHAAPGGGTTGPGPAPDPIVGTHNAYTLQVQGGLATAADGALSLTFKLFELDPACDLALLTSCTTALLFEETANVAVTGRTFTHALGSTLSSGLSPELFAGKRRLRVSWYAPSAPTAMLGSQNIGSTPYAFTLVPGAHVEGSSYPIPTVELGNTVGPALRARVTSANASGAAVRAPGGFSVALHGGTGVDALSKATTGTGAGVVAITHGSQSTALSVAFADDDALTGRNDPDGSDVFRVTGGGDVFVQNQVLPIKGAKGPPGNNGSNGSNGSSPSSTTQTLCTVTPTNCTSVCFNGSKLLGSIAAPCGVATSTGFCERNMNSGACCICSSSRN